MLDAIWAAIGDIDAFAARAAREPVSLTIRIKDVPTFVCEVRLQTRKSKGQLTAELPAAIVAAFESAGIGR